MFFYNLKERHHKRSIKQVSELSRRLLQFSRWRYWSSLSRYVYGGNRSFAPILRQSLWSLLYDVY
jgi:hypothetical protein